MDKTSDHPFIPQILSEYGYDSFPVKFSIKEVELFLQGMDRRNAYGKKLKNYIIEVMKIMRFSQVLGNANMYNEKFDILFGNLSYLGLPLESRVENNFEAEKYIKKLQKSKPWYSRDRDRLEMIKYCKNPFTVDCKSYFKHTFSYGGICNVFNGLPFENILKGSWYTQLMTLIFNMNESCLLYTSPSPRDRQKSRMPSSA